MGIQVVRFEHQVQRLHDAAEEESPDSLNTLLFDPRLERAAERTVGDRYRRLELGARSADVLIVRGSDTTIRGMVEGDRILRDQLKGKPVAVLAPAYEGARPTFQRISWSTAVKGLPGVDQLREAEILCGLHAEGAIFRQQGCHYLLPSASYHAEAFLRLADSLQDHIDLIRLSDWLIEMVDDRTALAADNGSLLGLLSTLAMRVRDVHGFTPPIATLNEYPISPTAIAETVDRFGAGGDMRLLFCVSVNSSGRVAREVNNLADMETQVVAICETRGKEDDDEGIERFARHEVERWPIEGDGRCPRCPEDHLLAVDPHSYEVRSNIQLKPVGLDLKYAVAGREFWEAAQAADAVRLHVEAGLAAGSATRSRHLAVQLDVAKMLRTSSAFRKRCLETLADISGPQLVLIPKHRCSDALKELVAEAFPALGDDQVMICGVRGEAPDLKAPLKDVKHVLIVDDTLVSGATLNELRRQVHSDSRDSGGAKVSIFVPLSRPAHPADEKFAERFAYPVQQDKKPPVEGGLHCAYRVLLPDGVDCPWCRERDMLEDRLDDLVGENRADAVERRRYLTRTDLKPPLLPCGEDDQGTIVGSFFGNLEPVTAFAAVSALAQHMLARINEDRHRETIQVVDVALILQAFYDPVIVAAMLRTLPPRALRDPWREPEVTRAIHANIKDYPDTTIAELALATIDGKLPVPAVRELLKAREDGWASLYLCLLKGY